MIELFTKLEGWQQIICLISLSKQTIFMCNQHTGLDAPTFTCHLTKPCGITMATSAMSYVKLMQTGLIWSPLPVLRRAARSDPCNHVCNILHPNTESVSCYQAYMYGYYHQEDMVMFILAVLVLMAYPWVWLGHASSCNGNSLRWTEACMQSSHTRNRRRGLSHYHGNMRSLKSLFFHRYRTKKSAKAINHTTVGHIH